MIVKSEFFRLCNRWLRKFQAQLIAFHGEKRYCVGGR